MGYHKNKSNNKIITILGLLTQATQVSKVHHLPLDVLAHAPFFFMCVYTS